jgi:hypothetical protein
MAYSEQLGVKRHEAGSAGDKNRLYARKRACTNCRGAMRMASLTSAAKAVIRGRAFGTTKVVPFPEYSLHNPEIA